MIISIHTRPDPFRETRKSGSDSDWKAGGMSAGLEHTGNRRGSRYYSLTLLEVSACLTGSDGSDGSGRVEGMEGMGVSEESRVELEGQGVIYLGSC